MSDVPEVHAPAVRYNFYELIPDLPGRRLLVVPSEDGYGWSLPVFHPEKDFLERPEHTLAAMREQLGIEVTMLRAAWEHTDREVERREDIIFVMENHSPGWEPTGDARWIERGDLATLAIPMLGQREVMENWFEEQEPGKIPALRAPWAVPGWYDAVTAWVRDELSLLDISLLGPLEQVKHWSISAVLKAPTSAGDYYFKAVPAYFAAEPRVTQALAELFPDYIPSPVSIASFPDQGWMLMRDFAGVSMRNATIPQLEGALRLLAQMQIAAAPAVDDLLAAGCMDRRLDRLAAQIDPLLYDPIGIKDLEDRELERLRALAPRLKEMCAQLAAYNLPQTLVHGDFHEGNLIARDNGHYLVFDWTDACIAHPFLDLSTVLDNSFSGLKPEERTYLRDAYLEAWIAYEPAERLREASALGERLSLLHQAISYRNILAGTEEGSRFELEGALPHWLRALLSYLEPDGV